MRYNELGGDLLIEKYKKLFAVVSSVLMIVVVFKITTVKEPDLALEVTLEGSNFVKKEIVIQVDGAVHTPGVYTLKEGDRVQDAIEVAGGIKEDALEELINYAAVLEDGQKILVMKKPPKKDTDSVTNENQNITIYDNEDYSLLEKINYMSQEEFLLIPGIGDKISEDIIQYRNTHGPFTELDQLSNVKGIGTKKIQKIVDFLF